MRKIRRATTIILTSFIVLVSCERSEIITINNKVEAKDFVNEEYHPKTTGKVIDAFYANQTVKLLEIENGKYLFDGDVILEREDFLLPGESPKSFRSVYGGNNWAYKTVRWQFDVDVDADLKNKWYAAVEIWKKDAGFKFTELTGTPTGNYILVLQNSNGSASSSFIGRKGGKQTISIDPLVYATGSVVHEIGHAIGLLHEQKRPDRDSYITVNYSNIISTWTSQYDKCTSCTANGTFDFNSIMLYASSASSKVAKDPNIPLMTKLDGSTWTAQRNNLSLGDLAGIKAKYP
jgi:Astacin (Peptidase family M12A)